LQEPVLVPQISHVALRNRFLQQIFDEVTAGQADAFSRLEEVNNLSCYNMRVVQGMVIYYNSCITNIQDEYG
jgi:hypothetical protein